MIGTSKVRVTKLQKLSRRTSGTTSDSRTTSSKLTSLTERRRSSRRRASSERGMTPTFPSACTSPWSPPGSTGSQRSRQQKRKRSNIFGTMRSFKRFQMKVKRGSPQPGWSPEKPLMENQGSKLASSAMVHR